MGVNIFKNNKRIVKNIFLISAIIVTKFSFSQAPEIEWDNTIGAVEVMTFIVLISLLMVAIF